MKLWARVMLFCLAVGILVEVIKLLFALLVVGALALAAFLILGTHHRKKFERSPVKCETCRGIGIIEDDLTHVHLCEVCNGSGYFARDIAAAITRIKEGRHA